MTVIGIDIGGHSIKGGIVTPKGKVLSKIVVLTEPEKGRQSVVSNIIKVAKDLLKIDPTIKKIGVGVPGVVDSKGYVYNTPNIPFSKYDLGKEMKKKLNISHIIFGNDADNFALAMHEFGPGKKLNTVVALTLGTGVGSGLIINGKVFANKGAPELGHTTIKYDAVDSKCCQNNGCLESFLGRKSFKNSPLDVYKKALSGDKLAIMTFDEYGKLLGVGISNFVNIFNPDAVIIGGELRLAYNFFKKSMDTEIKKRALFKTKVIKSEMMEAGMIGAAILAF
jgi:glucokinase